MPIIVGDTLHIDQVFRVDGMNATVGANYKLEDAGTALTDTDLVNSLINDNWTPTLIDGVWQAANVNKVEAVCVKIQKILPLPEDDFVILQNVLGGLLTDNLPSHAAAMIVKTSKSTGPGSSGRSFFPAPPEAHFDGGRLNAGGAVLWNAVASFLNDILTLGAFGTRWAPQHFQPPAGTSDVFRTWVSPNIRTIKTRQAVECPV